MLPGFNHNIKHKGRIYHIQTEDSGPKNPHIITHLFVGGNILATKKTTYAEIVGQPGYEQTVRSMMEEQHKQMLRNLINGVFDNVDTAGAHYLNGPPPLNTDGSAISPATAAIAGAAVAKGRPIEHVEDTPIAKPAGGVRVTSSPPEPPSTDPGALPPEVQAARNLPPEERPVEKKVNGPTIFGEDLISEKSLDEVILSYLAEDLADLD